jgi:GTP cyclohydrolase I
LEACLKPKGMMLIMSGRHLCKEMRGARKYNSPFDVDAVRGCFEGNPAPSCKIEFLMRIGNER